MRRLIYPLMISFLYEDNEDSRNCGLNPVSGTWYMRHGLRGVTKLRSEPSVWYMVDATWVTPIHEIAV